MITHHSSPNSFRLVEWPKSQASHLMFFTQDKHRYDMSVLVEFLSKALSDAHRAFVRHATFSLVNVTSPRANVSFGLAVPPHKRLLKFHPLSFTFAFTTKDKYVALTRPKFAVQVAPHTTMWGNTLGTNTDFLTINIPKPVMSRLGLSSPTLREMKWLYMAIGAWSKGFVQRSNYYVPGKQVYDNKPMDSKMAYSVHYREKLQHLFKHTEYNMWPYSKDMWDLAPNMIHPFCVGDDFADYYCRYLAKDYWGKYKKTVNIETIEHHVYQYLESGVLDAAMTLTDGSGNQDYIGDSRRSYETVLAMLPRDKTPSDYRELFMDIQRATTALLSGQVR